ncbi:hypothetical protein WH47_10847 [Habropoda laboriosa]|uniref:Uncharacterized protein n=1 Tax=Habropoda laboriosa TaxID=597456 RepID=A0A0L7RDH4_9HYME|nr:PREDICTED: probable serine/threonine-protein kinase clkA [Habropoda laboriosa]KOC68859.1 hypothetical protein WH47_10847 [Habropoda laboriosa]
MIKGKKEPKLHMQISEGRSIDGTFKNKNLNVKKKKQSALLQQCKNKNVKQKVKQKGRSKSDKVSKNLNASNMLLKYNKEMYEYQIQQLNLKFKQSLKYPTLTQDELKVLFVKYKSDGHYRTNKNLPPFTSLLNNTHNVVNEKNYFSDQAECISVSDKEKNCFGNSKDIFTNSNCNSLSENQYLDENSNIYENLQPNFKNDALQFTDTLNVHNLSNRIENKHLYSDQTSSTSNSYNHMYMNYNEQMHSNISISDNIQNTPNILSEEHQSCRYGNRNILCNISDSNVPYENLSSSNEFPQQNDIHCSLQDNNCSLNPNFYLNKWNNMTLIDKNNNHQSWKNTQSICIPHITNLESYYNIKNTTIPHQLTVIKNHSKEQGNLDLPIHTNPYYIIRNKNLAHLSNDDVSHMQQTFNHTTSSNIIPDNFLSEANTCIPSCANMIDQY